MLTEIQTIDESLMLFIQNHLRTFFLTPLMQLLSYVGYAGTIWIIISLFLIFTKKYPKAGICTLISMSVCYIFNDLIIKEIVMRPRPFLTMPDLTILTFAPTSWSFPSGHACSSFAAAYMLTKYLGKKGAAFYILAALIAFSRPYVGVHYVSDIVVGAIFGTIGSFMLYKIFCKTPLAKINENV